MVAFVSGNGLGLLTGSAGVLGQRGIFGNAVLGNNRESAYINVTTGNLVLQDSDDFLAAHGINVALSRTYNAQGNFNDGSGTWKFGLVRQVTNLTGTVNTAGSSITRIAGDGSASLFTWNTNKNAYTSNDGGGAAQSMVFSATTHEWTWRSDRFDNTGVCEVYDDSNGGRIVRTEENGAVRQKFSYNAAGHLAQITDSVGTAGIATDGANNVNDQTYFDYDANGNLSQIRTVLGGTAGSAVQSLVRTRYGYDSQNRLQTVTVDLSSVAVDPSSGAMLLSADNNSVADGAAYVTTYDYDGSSNRINKIAQSDGTELNLTYVQTGGTWKVDSISDALGRKTSIDYSVANRATITDALGLKTTYAYNSLGQLTDVIAPAVGNVSQLTHYTYDANGNVATATDPRGLVTNYLYDGNNNCITQWDSSGYTIARSYSATSNKLLAEAHYIVADADGAGTAFAPSDAARTSYVYDAANRLRYVIDPDFRVTEYRYNATGELASEIRFPDRFWPAAGFKDLLTLPESNVNTAIYTNNYFDRSKSIRTDYAYDARGLLQSATRYAQVDASGNGVLDGQQSVSRYVYDQAGQLLYSRDGNGKLSTKAYDGLGRLIAQTDANGTQVLSAYDSQSNLTVTTTAAGTGSALATTSYLRDKAGQIISVQRQYADGPGAGITVNAYDSNGRLRMSTDPAGQKTYWLYDEAGRKVAQIDHNGGLTEYTYNPNNQLVKTIRYASTVSTSALVDAQGQPSTIALAALRPAASAGDRVTWNGYDLNGRLAATVDANGFVTRMAYDGLDRMTSSTTRAKPIDISVLGNAPVTAAALPGETGLATEDRITRYMYDHDSHLIGTLDTMGYLTENRYDAGGRLIEIIRYDNMTPPATRASGDINSMRPAATANDVHQRYLYNNRDQQVGSIDGDNFLTEISYDNAGNVSSRRQYAKAVTNPAGLTLATVGKSISADDRLTIYRYTALNQLDRETTLSGSYTQYHYDAAGNLTAVEHGVANSLDLASAQRYDGAGHLIATLSADGAARLAALGATPDPAAVAQLWASYATRYSYDTDGLRTSMTDPLGNRTLYYYDSLGRLTHTIDALGQVTEQRYDPLSQVVKTIQYGKSIDPATLATLQGGRSTSSFTALILGLANISLDRYALFYYNGAGQLAYSIDGAGDVSSTTYNAFGQRKFAIHYGVQLSASNLAALSGGWLGNQLGASGAAGAAASALAAIVNSSSGNQRDIYYYDLNGHLIGAVNAAGQAIGHAYYKDTLAHQETVTQYGVQMATSTLTGASTEFTGFATANAGNAANRVTQLSYDRRGHVSDAADAYSNGNHTITIYNAFGQVAKVSQFATPNSTTASPATDLITQTIYDVDGRVRATVDGSGSVTAYQYDGAGHLTDKISYANALAGFATSADIGKTVSDALAAGTLSDPARDLHQRFIYVNGQLAYTLNAQQVAVTRDAQNQPLVAAKWSVSKLSYDADGRRTGQTSYSWRMDSASLTPTASEVQAWVALADARTINDPGQAGDTSAVSDSSQRLYYDAAGRVSESATAQRRADGAIEWAVVHFEYDSRDNVLCKRAYASVLRSLAPTAAEVRAMPGSAADAITWYNYDGENRVIATAVAQGPTDASANPANTQQWALSTIAYDGYGNVLKTTQCATLLLAATPPADLVAMASILAKPAADRVSRNLYDSVNRLTLRIDASGAITRYSYSPLGALTQTIAYAATTSAPDSISLSYNPAPTAADRVTRTVFDVYNRPVYEIDPLGAVTEHKYDVLGNVTSTVRYAVPLSASALAGITATTTAASVKALITLKAGVDRTETYSYDQDRNLRFSTDAAGYITEYRYNGLGQLTATLQYLQPNSTNGPAKTTLLAYDAAGRLASSTDGQPATEYYRYDGLGRKTSFTNKAGDTWTYQYDAAGRLVLETSPQVAAYQPDFGMVMGAWGGGQQLALLTRLEYDAFGNLTKRTEAAGSAIERITIYHYDNLGRQTQTVMAAVPVYDDAADPKNASSVGVFEKDSGPRITNVAYNAFGEAISSTDSSGRSSYKVYDQRGQVAYDIDAMGYVTAYTHDTFGNLTTLTRYYNALLPNSGPSPAQQTPDQFKTRIITNVTQDRTLRKAYDLLGRLIKVSEPVVTVYDQRALGANPNLSAGKTTETVYDSFGQTIGQAVYGADASGVRVTAGQDTRLFYDLRGNKSAEIAVLSTTAGGHSGTGYLTTYAYSFDAANKVSVVTRTESNNEGFAWDDSKPNGGAAPTASAQDRQSAAAYDLEGRLVSQTQLNATYVENGAQQRGNLVTTYGYDVLGRRNAETDALGTTTYTYYDKLGRTIGTARTQTAAQASVSAASGSPLTEFKLDLLGNIVIRIDYAKGALGTPTAAGAAPADVNDADNRVTTSRYNSDGRAIRVRDAEQFSRQRNDSLISTSYDVQGRVAKQWRSVTATDPGSGAAVLQSAFQITRYDELGQIKEVLSPGLADAVNGSTGGLVHKTNEYNAFGEIISSHVGTGSDAESAANQILTGYARYDQAGHAWLSNSGDGVDKVTLYDALGNATAVIRSTDSNVHALAALSSAAEVATKGQLLRNETRYDALGHVVDSRQVDDGRLTGLARVNGVWSAAKLDPGASTNLIVIGDSGDANNTVTVKYRQVGASSWTEVGAPRVQWLDRYLAFSTNGLPNGNYEYTVSVKAPNETAFDRLSGTMTIASQAAPQNAALLARAYLAILHRGPDLIGLNYYMDRLNQGDSLAHLVNDLLRSTEASNQGYDYTNGDSSTVIQTVLRNLGRGGPGDNGFAADSAYWARLYEAARQAGGDAPAQLLLDVIDSIANYSGTDSVLLAARTQQANQVLATLGYAQTYQGSDEATARAIALLAATSPTEAMEKARVDGGKQQWPGQIAQLYLALFGRAPEKAGLEAWIGAMAQGLTQEQVANGMLNSAEAKDPLFYPTDGLSADAYRLQLIHKVYLNVLGRNSTAAEDSAALLLLNGKAGAGGQPAVPAISNGQWVILLINQCANYTGADSASLAYKQAFNNRVAVALSFGALSDTDLSAVPVANRGQLSRAVMNLIGSGATAKDMVSNALAANQATIDMSTAVAQYIGTAANATPLETLRLQLSRLYVVLLNRTLDSSGLNYQLRNLTAGGGMPSAALWNQLATDLMASTEAARDATLSWNTLSDQQFVERLYSLALGKLPTSAGAKSEIAGFVAQLATRSRGEVAINVITGMLHFAGLSAEETALQRNYDNKAAVSLACAIDLGPYGWADNGAIQTGRDVLAKVSATDTKVALDYAYLQSQNNLRTSTAGLTSAASNAAAALTAASSAAAAAAAAVTAAQTQLTNAAATGDAKNRLTLMGLYVGLLGRNEAYYSANPDLVGLDFQASLLASQNIDTVVQGFLNSPDGAKLYASVTDPSAFVTKVYTSIMGGNAGQDFYANWVAQLNAGASRSQVTLGILNEVLNYANFTPNQSALAYLQGRQAFMTTLAKVFALVDTAQTKLATDAQNAAAGQGLPTGTPATLQTAITNALSAQATALDAITRAITSANLQGDGTAGMRLTITRLYVTLLGYAAAPSLDEINRYLIGNPSPESVAQEMISANSALFPADNTAFVTKLFSAILGRAPGPGDDLSFWTNQLDGTPAARGRVAMGILNGYVSYSDSSLSQMSTHASFDTKISNFMAQEKAAADNANSAAARDVTSYHNATTTAQANKTSADGNVTTTRAAASNATTLANADYAQKLFDYAAYQNAVTSLYVAIRGTTAVASLQRDMTGRAFQMWKLATGATTLDRILTDLMAADGYPTDNTLFVQRLYKDVLGRPGTADEWSFWANRISSRTDTQLQVAQQIIASGEAAGRRADPLKGAACTANCINDDISNANKFLAARDTANANYAAAVAAAAEAAKALTTAQQDESQANLRAAAASKAAVAAAAVSSTILPKITAATTAALTTAKARAAYDLAMAQAYAKADHAGSLLAAANAQVALTQTNVGIRYVADSNAPANERQTRQVAQVFQLLLNRPPQLSELSYWNDKLASGASVADLAATLLARDAAATYPATMTNDAFVKQLYTFGLNRAADAPGLAAWTALLTNGGYTRAQLVAKWINDVSLAASADAATFATRVAALLQSVVTAAQSANGPNLMPTIQAAEADARAAAMAYDSVNAAALAANTDAQRARLLAQLYTALLNRAPDAAGLNSWINSMKSGTTPSQVAAGMLALPEGVALLPASLNNHDFAKQVLNNVFGRLPTEAEITPYVTQLATKSRADVSLAIISTVADGAAADLPQMTARLSFNSRVTAGLDKVGADASAAGATAAIVKSLLQKLSAANPIDRHIDGVVQGVASVAQAGTQAPRSANLLTLDRWGNVISMTDARDPNWKISYQYNYNNQLVDQTLNTLSGATAVHSTNGYDRLGRLVSSTDFNGNASSKRYDANGNVVQEQHADGGMITSRYTLFGQRSTVITQRGYGQSDLLTTYTYDHLGHLATVSTGATAGQKIDVYSATYFDVNDADAPVYSSVDQLTTRYAYDELGRNISITNADGSVSTSDYDLDGNVIRTVGSYKTRGPQRSPNTGDMIPDERQTVTLNSYDAFHHVLRTRDGNGNIMIWDTDSFGRVTSHTDLGGGVITSQYNAAGQLISQTTLRKTIDPATGQASVTKTATVTYSYSGTLLSSIDQSDTTVDVAAIFGNDALHYMVHDGMVTTYRYDAVGNRIGERQSYHPDREDPATRLQNNTNSYDMQNRLVGVKDDQYAVTYAYDNNGNRLSVHTTNNGQDLGTVYNSYDSMNRQLIVNGASSDSGKTVTMGEHGHQITYDWAGNRLSDSYIGLKLSFANGFYNTSARADQVTKETYSYDAMGRLIMTQRDGVAIDQRRYDAASRVTQSGFLDYSAQPFKNAAATSSLNTLAKAIGVQSGTTTYHYDDNGRIQRQYLRDLDGQKTTDYYYVNDSRLQAVGITGGYDGAGNLLGYTVVTPGRKWQDYGRYQVTYSAFDSYKEHTHQVDKGDMNISSYDIFGNRTAVTLSKDINNPTAKFWYDANGHVQSKIDYANKDNSGNPTSSFAMIVNDQVLGYEDGDANNILGSTYSGAISAAQATTPSAYSVQHDGETLQSIAQAVWGDAKLWYLIADANGIDAGETLKVGRVLNIPLRVNTVHGDYATYKPYNASEAIGNTAPALPPPTHNHHGSLFGSLVSVIAAVGVAYLTGGVFANPILSAAFSGAAGSVAGQVAGHIVDPDMGFSWRGVALGAVSAGVTQGVAQLATTGSMLSSIAGDGWSEVAARAAVANIGTQAIANVTGLQHGFNWTNVAASYAGAAASTQTATFLSKNSVFSALGDFAGIARASVSGFAGGLTTAVAHGGKIAVAQIATDAFGNALGSSLASMNSGGSEQQPAAQVTPAKSFSDSIDRGPEWFQNWKAANPGVTSTDPNVVAELDDSSPDAPPPPSIRSAGGNPAVISAELKKLPGGVTDALRNGGIQIVAVKDSIVEAFPDLQGVTPRGWGGTGKTWNDVPGVFKSDRMTVAVATSGKFPTGSDDMILHEIGHGYDFAMGTLSSSPSFIRAYDADKAHFTGYYTQPGDAGHEELFAESFANYYNRNTKYFENKPNVLAYWKSLPQPMQPPKVRK